MLVGVHIAWWLATALLHLSMSDIVTGVIKCQDQEWYFCLVCSHSSYQWLNLGPVADVRQQP